MAVVRRIAGGMFRKLRITFLLLLLVFVAANAWLSKLRSTDWDRSLWVVVYPINGDKSTVSSTYIGSVRKETFSDIEEFMAREARRYQLRLDKPVTIKLGPVVNDLPPKPPRNGDVLAVMWWSLQMRYWAFKSDTYDAPSPDIRMFVVYHDPETHDSLDHSFGLEKGLVGVVNAFASEKMAGPNNVVIAHELLHTVGATDKYDLATNFPVYPEGYAEPRRQPRLPQSKAEIMGGRVPLSEQELAMPSRLTVVVIGEKTAHEINWINPE